MLYALRCQESLLLLDEKPLQRDILLEVFQALWMTLLYDSVFQLQWGENWFRPLTFQRRPHDGAGAAPQNISEWAVWIPRPSRCLPLSFPCSHSGCVSLQVLLHTYNTCQDAVRSELGTDHLKWIFSLFSNRPNSVYSSHRKK